MQTVQRKYIGDDGSTLQKPGAKGGEGTPHPLAAGRALPQPKVAPPDRGTPRPALGPGHPAPFDELARPKDFDPFPFDPMFEVAGKQHAKRTIGVQDVPHVAHADGHLRSVAPSDPLKRRRVVEGLEVDHANGQPDTSAHRFEIDDAARPIGSFVVLESALQP